MSFCEKIISMLTHDKTFAIAINIFRRYFWARRKCAIGWKGVGRSDSRFLFDYSRIWSIKQKVLLASQFVEDGEQHEEELEDEEKENEDIDFDEQLGGGGRK